MNITGESIGMIIVLQILLTSVIVWFLWFTRSQNRSTVMRVPARILLGIVIGILCYFYFLLFHSWVEIHPLSAGGGIVVLLVIIRLLFLALEQYTGPLELQRSWVQLGRMNMIIMFYVYGLAIAICLVAVIPRLSQIENLLYLATVIIATWKVVKLRYLTL